MRIDLDEAERLSAAAHEGPWECDCAPGYAANVFAVRHPVSITVCEPSSHHDAAFIAHARTFVPAAVARIRELEAALAKYGAHVGHHETGRGPACSRRDGSECDCGLDAALGRQR